MNSRNLLKLFVVFGLSLLGLLIGPVGLAHIASTEKADALAAGSDSGADVPSIQNATLARDLTQVQAGDDRPARLDVVPPPQSNYLPPTIPISGILTVTKRVVGTPVTGVPLTYSLRVTNTSLVTPATDVVISDVVPTGATYVPGSGGTLVNDNTVVWTITNLAPNTDQSLNFAVTSCQSSLLNQNYRVVTSTQEFVSNPGPAVATTLGAPGFQPGFAANPNPVLVGQPVYFTDTTTFTDTTIVTRSWTFGDSNSASGPNVSHSYGSANTYNVQLTVIDHCGVSRSTTQMVTVNNPPPPILNITKTDAPDPVEAGQPLTYTVVVVNSGGSSATGGVISDSLPANTTFVPGSLALNPPGAGTLGSQPPTLVTGLNIAAGQRVTLTYRVMVNTPLTDALRITNTAAVTSVQLPTPNLASTTSEVNTTPKVAVVKTGPGNAQVGQTAFYTFTITNPGNTRLQIQNVVDNVAGAAAYLSGDNGNNRLDLGETWTYRASHIVSPNAPNPLVNTVIVTAADSLGRQTTATANANTIIEYNPVVTITKGSALTTALVNDDVAYSLTIAHAGNSDGSPVNTILITDSVAGPINCGSVDPNGNGRLDGGEQWLCTFFYTIRPTDTTPLQNQVTFRGVDGDGDTVNRTSNVHVLNIDYMPRLAINKTGPTTARVGNTVVYTFTVTNNNALPGDGSPINTVAVNDSRLGSIPYRSGDDGDNFLEVGETWLYTSTYTILVTNPDPLTNTATVTGLDGNGQPATPASDGHSLNIDFRPVLTITKTGPANANVGQTVAYTFTVSHAGSSDGSPVHTLAVNDNPVGAATYISGDTGDDGLLSAGEIWTYRVTYQIPPTAPNLFVNTGTVTGLDRDNQAIPSASASFQTNVEFAPRLTIAKTGPASANVGQTVAYTFTLSHAGNSDNSPVSDVAVNDNLAGAATYVSGDTGNDDLLSAGETWRFRVQYTIPPTATDPFTNTGIVSGLDGDGQAIPTASASHSTLVNYAPRLRLVMSGPIGSVNVGSNAPYVLQVSHNPTLSDRSPITNVVVGDSLGTNYAYSSGDAGGPGGSRDGILSYGETWSFIGFYPVPPTAPDPLINTGQANGLDFDGEAVPQATASWSVGVNYDPDVLIDKIGPNQANVGQTVVYSFNVQIGPGGDGSPLRNVLVTDSVAGPASYVSGDTNNNSRLNASETWRFRVQYTIPPTTTDPLSNVGTVTARSNDLTQQVEAMDTHITLINFNPRLKITKSGPSVALVGQTVSYTFQVQHATNSDKSAISNVAVVDSLAGPAIRATNDSDNLLSQGETWTFVATYTIKATDPDPLVNTATVSGDNRDDQALPTANAQHSTDIDFKPTLSIVTGGPTSVYVGQHAVYTYSISHNPATSDKTPINTLSVTDNKFGAATFVGGDTNSNNRLDFGETWQYTATYIILSTDGASFNHTGTANGKDKDGQAVPQANSNQTVNIVGAPELVVTKSGPATAKSGRPITYTVTVTNVGIFPAFNLVITDVLPAGVTYLQGGNLNQGVVEWTEGVLQPNSSAKFTVSATALNDATNSAYGVRADGLQFWEGSNVVQTKVTQFSYMPALFTPVTNLSIFNDRTGGIVGVKLFYPNTNTQVPNTGCNVPNNQTLPCGSFSPGWYTITITSSCTVGGLTRLIEFEAGNRTIRVFCNSSR